MASKSLHACSRKLSLLWRTGVHGREPLVQQQCVPGLSRSMATETSLPRDAITASQSSPVTPETTGDGRAASTVLTTIYNFPTMEPLRFEHYKSKHLHLPLRRDILHRAVVFEGDMTRQGTASTKNRWEVHGGHRKIRPQKGTGKARLGTRQSPMLRGGGKSFGPHPRDFATLLPRKIYDLAWRTALSYRFRRGELFVCEDGVDLESSEGEWARQVLRWHRWGKDTGRTLIVTSERRGNLFDALEEVPEEGRALTSWDVDVKDLLETGRVMIEKSALDEILSEHQSDLTGKVRSEVSGLARE